MSLWPPLDLLWGSDQRKTKLVGLQATAISFEFHAGFMAGNSIEGCLTKEASTVG